MFDATVNKMAKDFNLDRGTAEKILKLAILVDQGQPGPLIVGVPEQEIPGKMLAPSPSTPSKPVPKETTKYEPGINPYWQFKVIYDPVEPYVTWVPGSYFMSKAGASFLGGLPLSAAAPVKLGGAKPTELFAAIRHPEYGQKLQEFFKNNPKPLARAKAARPEIPALRSGGGTGGTGGEGVGTSRATAGVPTKGAGKGGFFTTGGGGGMALNLLAVPGVMATFENLLNYVQGEPTTEPYITPEGQLITQFQ